MQICELNFYGEKGTENIYTQKYFAGKNISGLKVYW